MTLHDLMKPFPTEWDQSESARPNHASTLNSAFTYRAAHDRTDIIASWLPADR